MQEKWPGICHHCAIRAMGRRAMGRLTHPLVRRVRSMQTHRATVLSAMPSFPETTGENSSTTVEVCGANIVE
jgi:hypothetical protein